METGEGRPIHKRRAIDRGRKISNAAISLILSFVVTAAAQSERINQEVRTLAPATVSTPLTSHPMAGHVQERHESVPVTPSNAAGYNLAKREIKDSLTIINGF